MVEQEQTTVLRATGYPARGALRLLRPALTVFLPAAAFFSLFHFFAVGHLEDLAHEVLRERSRSLCTRLDRVHAGRLERLRALEAHGCPRAVLEGSGGARERALVDLERVRGLVPDLLELAVLDRRGQQVFPESGEAAPAQRHGAMRAAEGGGSVAGCVLPRSGSPRAVEYAVQVLGDGGPVGVLVGRFHGEFLERAIREGLEHPSAFPLQLELFDAHGILLASSRAPGECGRSCVAIDPGTARELAEDGFLLGPDAPPIARSEVSPFLARSRVQAGDEREEEGRGRLSLSRMRTAPWIVSMGVGGGPFQRLNWILLLVLLVLAILCFLVARLWRWGFSQRLPSSGALLAVIGLIVAMIFAAGGWVLRVTVVHWAEEVSSLAAHREGALLARSMGHGLDVRIDLLEDLPFGAAGAEVRALAPERDAVLGLYDRAGVSLAFWRAGSSEPERIALAGGPPGPEASVALRDPRPAEEVRRGSGEGDGDGCAPEPRIEVLPGARGATFVVVHRLSADGREAISWLEPLASRRDGQGGRHLLPELAVSVRGRNGEILSLGAPRSQGPPAGPGGWESVSISTSATPALEIRVEAPRFPAGFESLIHALTISGAMFSLVAGVFTYLGARAVVAHREASRRDPLTSLPNRRTFNEMLDEELAKAMRYDRPLSLAILDLDHFKAINDSLGHRAGDRVLEGASKILATSVRRSDRVFRFGGEEFAILMPETDELAAAVALERVRVAFEHARISYGRGTVLVHCSIGVTGLIRGETGEDLVVRADSACYAGKSRGRNQVVLFRIVDEEIRELSVAEIAGGDRA